MAAPRTAPDRPRRGGGPARVGWAPCSRRSSSGHSACSSACSSLAKSAQDVRQHGAPLRDRGADGDTKSATWPQVMGAAALRGAIAASRPPPSRAAAKGFAAHHRLLARRGGRRRRPSASSPSAAERSEGWRVDASAIRLMERLGLRRAELCAVLDADPLSMIGGELDHRPELGILLALTGEAPSASARTSCAAGCAPPGPPAARSIICSRATSRRSRARSRRSPNAAS